jgi:hypothetical protein
MNRLKANSIENIRVISEYPDIFPDDLPPGTTPIAKKPCRMSVGELEELKKQQKELLDKQFIHPSSSP